MIYLKSDELSEYLTRAEVPEGDERKWARAASILADAWCRRALAITRYHKTIKLNSSCVGYLGVLPFVQFDPQETSTGLRIMPKARTRTAGYAKIGVDWIDIGIPSSLDQIIDKRTGKIELSNYSFADYGRGGYGGQCVGMPMTSVSAYDAEVEFLAGYFASSKSFQQLAANTSDTLRLESNAGFKVGKIVNLGDLSARYRVVNLLSDGAIQFDRVIEVEVKLGDEVSEVAPDAVKFACAYIIEDRLTFEPNSNRLSEELASLLKTRSARVNDDALPQDAQEALKEYRYESFGG